MAFAPSLHQHQAADYAHPSSYHPLTRNSRRSFAINSLFIADPMHGAADITTSLSRSHLDLANWNPLQKDIGHWLNDINNTPRMGSSSSISSIITSSSSSSTTQQRRRPDRSPTKDEITLLQTAFASFYGAERNAPEAYELLSKCITIWETTHQGGDEIAGLYRVRGEVHMELFQPQDAEADYTKAIQYLNGPDGDLADPEELPAARLGRARAIRSLGSAAAPSQALGASNDYEIYFKSMTQDDNAEDTTSTTNSKSRGDKTLFSEVVVDGIQRNPYAAWEWGMVNRAAHSYDQAAEIHRLAAIAFEVIGDKPRSVLCALDRGLDLACGLESNNGDAGQLAKATQTLEEAIQSDVNVEGQDVELLQRLVAKEGEARLALAGVLWNTQQKGAAEAQYGTACSRLDELNADYRAREEDRVKKGRMLQPTPRGANLGYSMDNIVGAEEASCSRFKNDKFIEEKLVWNENLQIMVKKFLTLSR